MKISNEKIIEEFKNKTDERKLNIAIFTDSYLPGVGGIENALYNQVIGLTKLGHHVMVCCPKYFSDKTNFCSQDGMYQINRCNSICFSEMNYIPLPSMSRNFKKNIIAFKPDIIHCTSAFGVPKCGIQYAKKHNIPVVYTIHTDYKTSFKSSIKSNLIISLLVKSLVKKLKSAKIVTTVSLSMAKKLNEYGYKRQVNIIKNGYISKIVNLNTSKENLDNLNFIFVGHLVKEKRIKFILDALKIFKEKYSIPFTFTIVGYGNRKYFENIAKKNNLEKEVVFHGVEKNKDNLAKMYNNSHLLLFPSLFDNDSLVVVEAGMCSTPSLVIENSGSSERITNNINGFTSKDSEEFYAQRIYDIVSNKKEYQEVVEKTNTLIKFTWDEICKTYEQVYFDVLNK